MLDIFKELHAEEIKPGLKEVQVGSFSFSIPDNAMEVVESAKSYHPHMVHWVSRAEWSAIDLLTAILSMHSGAADITLSSYAFSERPARILANLMSEGKIAKLHCIIDSRVDVRSQTALQLIKGCAQKLKLVDTHAKVTVVHMDGFWYTVVGSANYTSNRRFEAGFITTHADIAAFHTQWINNVLDADTGATE
jgi:hypothetical protein